MGIVCFISPPQLFLSRLGFADRFSKSDRWASPGFSVDFVSVGELHAAFLNESRTRGRWWRPVAGNPGRHRFRPTYPVANEGHPSDSLWTLLRYRLLWDWMVL